MGSIIHKKLDGKSISEALIKRSDHIKPLSHLQPGIQVEKQKIHIDSTILFSRRIAIAEREVDMKPYFNYELPSVPTSLFKDGFIRSAKSQLANFFTSSINGCEYQRNAKHVIDGGALLHRVKWEVKTTYQVNAKQYVSYVQIKYGEQCSIVFDGYEQGPSIKDHASINYEIGNFSILF